MKLFICPNCQGTYVPIRSNQRFCGPTCRTNFHNHTFQGIGANKYRRDKLNLVSMKITEYLEMQGFKCLQWFNGDANRRRTILFQKDERLYLVAIVCSSNLVAYPFPPTYSNVTFATIEETYTNLKRVPTIAFAHLVYTLAPHGLYQIIIPKRIPHPQKHLDPHSTLPTFKFPDLKPRKKGNDKAARDRLREFDNPFPR